ncbi:MAG: hypothetical protein ACK55Z_34285, partial [bacterium]
SGFCMVIFIWMKTGNEPDVLSQTQNSLLIHKRSVFQNPFFNSIFMLHYKNTGKRTEHSLSS